MRKIYLIILFFLMVRNTDAQVSAIEKIWETSNGIHIPESVLYYAPDNKLYVSMIGKGGTDKGAIAKLNSDGSIDKLNWITGLNAPKGMAIHKGLLYVADITKVVIIDVVTSNIIDEIQVEGSTFLNDVTVDDVGVVYVSDTRANKIFQLKSGKISVYLENVPNVNGLKYHNGKLLALADKEFWEIDRNKTVKVFTKGFALGGDGLEPVSGGGFIVTCWGGLVYFVKPSGEIVNLQDVQGKMNTADLGYNPKENVIYIPTFNSNSVIAYKLK